jgi:hypothetical protein
MGEQQTRFRNDVHDQGQLLSRIGIYNKSDHAEIWEGDLGAIE